MRDKRQLTFKVAISGITAAIVTVFLAGATYSPVGKISFYVLAGISLLLPLTSGSLWACVMAYIAGGALGLIFSVIGVLPFILIFGLQAVLFGACLRFRIKPVVYLPVKAVVFVGALYVVMQVYGLGIIENLFSRIGIPYKFLYVALLTTPVYVLYDYSIKFVYGWLRRRMKKAVSKYLHPKEKKITADDDVFDIEISNSTKTEEREDDGGEREGSVTKPAEGDTFNNEKDEEK